ncbi:MAG: hypothetical protein IPM57_11435 [Oligoflexia bacterium]|nr:hypothetical protein [Oligoflexia bacterium]
MNKKFIIVTALALLSSGCSYSFLQKGSSYPSGTTSSDFPDYDHIGDTTPTAKKLPSEVLKESSDLLEEIFLVKNEGDYRCIDPNTFQKFIEMFFRTEKGISPKLDYLCFFKKSPFYDHELRWVLNHTAGGVWTILPPTGLVDMDMSALKSLSVDEESSLSIFNDGAKSILSLRGFKFNLSKSAVAGTAFTWVPEAFLSFDVDKIEVTDDGQYLVKLKLPFGFPIKFEGEFEVKQNLGRVKFIF